MESCTITEIQGHYNLIWHSRIIREFLKIGDRLCFKGNRDLLFWKILKIWPNVVGQLKLRFSTPEICLTMQS